MIAAVIAFIATHARADSSGIGEIRAFDNSTSLELGVAHIDYAEIVDGVKYDTERAWLPTLSLGTGLIASDAARAPWRNLYLHFDLSTSLGTTTYNGAICDGITCSAATTDDDTAFVDAALKIGRGYAFGSRAMLIPFGEVDYRFWSRNLQGPGGYTEDYSNGAGAGRPQGPVQSGAPLGVVGLGRGRIDLRRRHDLRRRRFSVGQRAGPAWRGADRPAPDRPTDRYRHARLRVLSYGQSATTFNGFCAGVGGCFEPHSTTEQFTLTTGLAYRF